MTLHLASDNSIYSGTYLSMDSTGTLKVDANTIGSANVYIKMVGALGIVNH